MNLLLWRHATAEDASGPGEAADLARPLTKRGHRQAALVAEWLQKRLPADCQVLVSPAVRTRETAAALTTDFRIVEALAPGAPAATVIAATGWPDHRGTIVVVGHQPTLGHVAATLLGGRADDWSVKKGAVWWLTSRDREEGQGVILRAVMSPDLV